jgi:hypothetical protein
VDNLKLHHYSLMHGCYAKHFPHINSIPGISLIRK